MKNTKKLTPPLRLKGDKMKKIQYKIDGIDGKVDIVQELKYALIACVGLGVIVYCWVEWGF